MEEVRLASERIPYLAVIRILVSSKHENCLSIRESLANNQIRLYIMSILLSVNVIEIVA
jgi:hypothetical protein